MLRDSTPRTSDSALFSSGEGTSTVSTEYEARVVTWQQISLALDDIN